MALAVSQGLRGRCYVITLQQQQQQHVSHWGPLPPVQPTGKGTHSISSHVCNLSLRTAHTALCCCCRRVLSGLCWLLQDFRKHLIGLTDVTHTSFDKLVAQLERGFEDMDK